MRKTLIAAAVVAAGAAGYYFLSKQDSQAFHAELAYVPADTVLFSGQFKALDMVSYLATVGITPDYLKGEDLQQGLAVLQQQAPAAGQFALALFEGFINALGSPEQFERETGIANASRSLFYLVGAAPVIRLELANEQAFLSFLDNLGQRSGLSYQDASLNGHSFRRYRTDDAPEGFELLVSTERGWATIALHHHALSDSHRLQSLALEQPAKNLANSGKLENYVKQYQLKTDGLGFFSTEQLALALTTTDGNQLARDLQLTFNGEVPEALQSWQTPACRTDMQMLAQTWPGMVMDSELVTQANGQFHIRSKMLLPTSSKVALEGLQGLQGFIPAALNGKVHSSMFYLALGTEISQLTPSVSKIWAGMTDLAVSCEPLVAVQEQMKAQNPLMMLAMAGMAANGLQGFSVTINGFSLDPATGQPNQADALVTVSADNPQTLAANAIAMAPMLAGIQLPAAGEEISVSEVFPPAAMLGLDLRLKASANHLMLYVGDKAKAQATQLASEKLTKNGIMAVGADYKQFFSALSDAAAMSGQPVPDELKRMMDSNMQLGFGFGIEQHGIVFNTELKTSR
ncbi:MAG: hypothetical protein ACK4S8_01070 [Alishewanella aestuarii]